MLAPEESRAAMNAQTNPTAASRLFFTCRWVMRMLRLEALVTGADPANAFNARASANRVRSSPISASRWAPVRSASPTNEVMIRWSGCWVKAPAVASPSRSTLAHSASRVASTATAWMPKASSTRVGCRNFGSRSCWWIHDPIFDAALRRVWGES